MPRHRVPSYGHSRAERRFRAGGEEIDIGVSILGKCAEGREAASRLGKDALCSGKESLLVRDDASVANKASFASRKAASLTNKASFVVTSDAFVVS